MVVRFLGRCRRGHRDARRSSQIATGWQPPWLRGPVEGIPALLQPVVHALIDADEDVRKVVSPLTTEQLTARPSGAAASVAFHVTHAMGSLDRLFTYARDETLSEAQLATLSAEKTRDFSGMTAADLVVQFGAAIERATAQLRATRESQLLETRLVGRAKVPSNVLGLLFHAAEHTSRHVGQIVTTAKVVSTLE
jgi:uncharacterized damage-inducible protein DinB